MPSYAQHCPGRAFTVVTEKEIHKATEVKKYSWSIGQVIYLSDQWVDLGKAV